MSQPLVFSSRIPDAAAAEMAALIEELYPLCRSITGDGVRQTLAIVSRRLPLRIHEVPSGTKVLDWTVPDEWNVRDAYVADSRGNKVIDFCESNLHVVNYSVPIRASMTLEQLRPHLHTLPDHPDWIPYRTTYYQRDWGFCLRHRDLLALEDDQYEVVIDATLEPGHLTYGELVVEGRQSDEVLLSTHVCHPSLVNDNLSGVAVLTALGQVLRETKPRYTHRLLFIPGTIGAITWLALHRDLTSRIRHGLVLSGVGDRGPASYKRSRRGDAEVDRAMAHVLAHGDSDARVADFSPYGYDERQYCSPGFDLPVGRFSRSEYGTYPQYHTSADDLAFVSGRSLTDSLTKVGQLLTVLEGNATYRNTNPYGEPQLGRRGLYDGFDAQTRLAFLWVLNLSDGKHSLLDVAERSKMPFASVLEAASALQDSGLLERTP